jgi:hypothetical protein
MASFVPLMKVACKTRFFPMEKVYCTVTGLAGRINFLKSHQRGLFWIINLILTSPLRWG